MNRKTLLAFLAALLILPAFAAISRADFGNFVSNVKSEQKAQKEQKEKAKAAPKPKPQKRTKTDGFSIGMTKPVAKATGEFPRGSAEADYAAIYRAYLASNYNAVNVDAVAVDYYEVFAVPHGKIGSNSASAECRAYANQWKAAKSNSATNVQLTNEARVTFQQGLRKARTAPKTVQVQMKTTGTLGQYDRDAKTFPVKVRAVRPYLRAPRSICQATDHATKGRSLAPRGTFKADIQGGNADRIATLPMSQSRADAYLKSHPKRDVDLIVQAEVGPIHALNGKLQPAPVRFASAQAVDPKSGRTVGTYTSAAFSGAAVASATTKGGDSQPAQNSEVWGASDEAAAAPAASSAAAAPAASSAAAAPAASAGVAAPAASASAYRASSSAKKKSGPPSYYDFWRIYMAGQYNRLKVSAVAVAYYEAFEIPGTPSHASRGNSQSPECQNYQRQWQEARGNEFKKARLLEQIEARFAKVLEGAKGGPTKVRFTAKGSAKLGNYDMARQVFPINVQPRISNVTPKPGTYCPAVGYYHNYSRLSGYQLSPRGSFGFRFQNSVLARELRMNPSSAEAYLSNHPDRVVEVHYELESGPVTVNNGHVDRSVPTRVLSATVLDPSTGQVLAKY
ncbi:MAG: DUF4852 domain-containing protein [Deltaproteobacteria bacterium]|nr:DUF4852 domain-containing protein [Deltaproteobacteria bacterium]